MNIENMTDEQKSLLLAKLNPAWKVEYIFKEIHITSVAEDEYHVILRGPDYLYNKRWMWLAWHVLRWAAWNPKKIDGKKSKTNFFGYMNFGDLCQEKLENYFMLFLPQDEVQHLLLDGILELAIEFGIVADD